MYSILVKQVMRIKNLVMFSRRHVQPQTLRHIEIALTVEWNNIPLNLIRRFIHSMRNRCIPVINAFGGRTWY